MPQPTPPQPKNPKPIRHKPTEGRPLTDRLMARINQIIENSGGKITRDTLADAIGKGRNQTAEYILGFRSAPNSETTLRLVQFSEKHDPKK